MRIVMADFAGHSFPFQLSTELARRGHDVTHTWCASQVTPQGALDHPQVRTKPVDLGHPFRRYRRIPRIIDELRYGMATVRVIRSRRAEVVVTSNMPVLSAALVWLASVVLRFRWILWLQDLQAGLATLVLGGAGPATRALAALERFLVRRAEAVVAISPEFAQAAIGFGARPDRVVTIENWAPIDQLPALPRHNPWAAAHDLDDRFVFLYSGTLGKKHSPQLLLELADEFVDDPSVRVVVVAQGAGADLIAPILRPNMMLLPFQPFDRLPEVLASADVLVALLDPEAGGFSVPSKTLSYLCAGRPVLASIPSGNAAARLIAHDAAAGVVVDGADPDEFRAAARSLFDDPTARLEAGRRARRFAEERFDIDAIADRFEQLLTPERSTDRT